MKNYCLFVLLLMVLASGRVSVAMIVTIFNVGQGSCALIEHPDKNKPTLLADAGSSKHPEASTKDETIECIVKKIVDRKQRLIIVTSHGDADHINWIPNIVDKLHERRIPIKALLLGGPKADYSRFIGKVKRLNKVFSTDIDTFKRLLPDFCSLVAYDNEACGSKNNRSLILKVSYKRSSMLLAGDATGNVLKSLIRERQQANLGADVLVSPHHGSKNEGCNEQGFIDEVAPEIILISAAESSNNKHPSMEIFLNAHQTGTIRTQTTYHLVTFHLGASETKNESIKRLKKAGYTPIIIKEGDYCIALTKEAIYCTRDSGNLEVTLDDGIVKVSGGEESPTKAAAVRTLFRALSDNKLGNLKQCLFSGLGLQDNDLKELTALPTALTEFNLKRNKLTSQGLKSILLLLKKHGKPVETCIDKMGLTIDDLRSLMWENPALLEILMPGVSVAVVLNEEKSTRQLTDYGQIRVSDPVAQKLLSGSTDSLVRVLDTSERKRVCLSPEELRRNGIRMLLLYPEKSKDALRENIAVTGDDYTKILWDKLSRMHEGSLTEEEKIAESAKIDREMSGVVEDPVDRIVLNHMPCYIPVNSPEAEKLKERCF